MPDLPAPIPARARRRVAAIVLLLSVTAGAPARGDVRASGREAVRDAVAAKIRAVDEAVSRAGAAPVTMLLRGNVLGVEGVTSTELSGTELDGRVVLASATAATPDGRYRVTFRFDGDALVYAHERFEPHPDASGAIGPGWERRSSYDGGAIGFAEVEGVGGPEPGADAARLVDQARRVRFVVQERASLVPRRSVR